MSTARWTWLVCMAGDNNLDGEIDLDLAEVRAGLGGGDVRVVAMLDRPRSTHIVEVLPEGLLPLSADPPQNTGDVRVIRRFLEYGFAYAPAERYAVVLWNHGTGVVDPILGRRPPPFGRLAPVGAAYARLRAAAGRTRIAERLRDYAVLIDGQRAVAIDEGQGDFIGNAELAEVFAVKPSVGRVELVGFDACSMACVEIVHSLRGVAPVLVGSQEVEPAAGWEWTSVMRSVRGGPGDDGLTVAGRLVAGQAAVARTRPRAAPITLSAVATARLDGFVARFTAAMGLLGALVASGGAARAAVWSAYRAAPRCDPDCYADLDAMLLGLGRATTSSPSVSAALGAARVALAPVVPERMGRLASSAAASGLSIYAPDRLIAREYAELPFGRETGWTSVLRELGLPG